MKKHHVKGLSVAVIRNHKIAILKSFGFSNIEAQRTMSDDTIYRAASLGKPVFAYIVVKLAQLGKIDLDRPLHTYINEKIVPDDYRSQHITARMILSHSSGLPNFDLKYNALQLNFQPGSAFRYSGHGYLYLQRVIETLSGKSLNELANELVFKPLGLTNSSFKWEADFQHHIATGYKRTGEKYPLKHEPSTGFSAWSLFTSAKDYAIFVSHMINTASTTHSVSSRLLEPQIQVASGLKWGMGWGIQDTKPHQSFWHWGSNPGFKHYVVAYPKEKIAVVVMSNSDGAYKIVDDVMAAAIGGSYPSYDWF